MSVPVLVSDAKSFRMSEPSEMRAPVSVPPPLQSDEFDDPYPHLAAARRRSAVATAWPLPVATDAPELGPIYSVLAYDESVQVLRDHETYSSRGLSEAMGPLFEGAIIAMDEPEHRLYRALVAPAFRHKVLERWQTTVVQPAIDDVIDTFIDHDRVDLVEHLTFAFPVRVIARILGLPEQDVGNFQRWSLDLINMFNDPEPGVRALEEFRSYFMAFITERRLAPRDDLISDLIQSEVDGHRLDDDAIFASVKMLLPAAGVERAHLVGHSLGGFVALSTAAYRPDRVSSPVLLDPAGIAPINMLRFMAWGFPVLLGSLAPARVRRWLGRRLRNLMLENKRASRLLLHGMVRHAPGFPLLKPLSDDELRTVSLPVALLIAAESEPFDPNELAARAEALLPHVSIEQLPGAGHALFVSHLDICAARIALTHT